MDGITKGFRIGFKHGTSTCKSASGNMTSVIHHPRPVTEYLGNMTSVIHHPRPVTEYLATEPQAERIVEILKEYIKFVHVTRFGVIDIATSLESGD